MEHLPQAGARIQRQPQTGVQFPWQTPLVATPSAPAAAPPSPAPAARPAAPARKPAAQPVRARTPPQPPAPTAWPALRLKLAMQLQWPPQPAAAQAAPPPAPRPAWWQTLLDWLQSDEHGKLQPPLPALIAEHASALREQADAALAARLGWALFRAQRFAEAAPWFEHALRLDPGSASAREGAFYALQRTGNLQKAFDVAAEDPALRAARANVAVQLALRAREQNDPGSTVHWLQQAIALGKDGADLRGLLAWSLLQAGDATRAAQEFATLYASRPEDADLAQGLSQSLQASGQTARLAQLAAQPGALANLVRRERAQRWLDLGLARDAAVLDPQATAALAGAAQPSVAAGVYARSKSGAPGTSLLRITQAPVPQLRWANHFGVWDAQLDRTRLDAGAAPAVGQVGSTLPGSLGSPARQDVGASGSLHWRSLGPQGLSASLGFTPTDGAVSSTWTGSIGWRDISASHSRSIGLERQQVDDSVLSLTGLRDPATGLAWGRVMREGLTAGGYQTLWPKWNGSAQLRIERLAGQNVASNDRMTASAGLSRDLSVPDMRFFSVGPSLSYDHYARNLSGFTWGQGGYFSPQDFSSAALLAVFQTADARRRVLAGQVQLGWQSVRQDASACLAQPAPVAAPACAPLAASRSQGLGSSTALQWSTLLAPHWALEGSALLRTGPAYHDRALYLGVRYFFSPRPAVFGSDLPAAR